MISFKEFDKNLKGKISKDLNRIKKKLFQMKLIVTALTALVSAQTNDPTAILDQLHDGCIQIIKSDSFGADSAWTTRWTTKDWVDFWDLRSLLKISNDE